jgi:chromosome segregation ATPase
MLQLPRMASEPENITLKQLAVLRAEMQEGFAKLTAEQALTSEKIGVLAASMVSMRKQVEDLTNSTRLIAVAVDDHTHQLSRINTRLDGMDARIDRIEKHLDLTHA